MSDDATRGGLAPPRISVSEVVTVASPEDGPTQILCKTPELGMVVLEVSREVAPYVFQAALASLPVIKIESEMNAEHPIFEINESAIGYDASGDHALILRFRMGRSIALRLKTSGIQALRDQLDTLLRDLSIPPSQRH